MEEIPRETSLYYVLNLALRNKVRAAVHLWRDYIWLLLHALRKLPPSTEATVFRGCKKSPADLGIELTKGFEFTWSSFSSTATTQGVMQTFVGQSGPRTLMTIKMVESSGRDVRDFSLFPGENEVLFPPNLCFEVVDSFDAGNQLIMVQCRQTETVDVILDLNGKRTGSGGTPKAPAMPTPAPQPPPSQPTPQPPPSPAKPTPQPPASPAKPTQQPPAQPFNLVIERESLTAEQVKNFRGPCAACCKPLAPCCCVSADGEAIFCCVPTDRHYFLPACLHMALCPQLGCDPSGGIREHNWDCKEKCLLTLLSKGLCLMTLLSTLFVGCFQFGPEEREDVC
jgi:hypothetical protein